MVRKVEESYYLNRAEAIDYLMHAFPLKWCITKWAGGFIRISFETLNGKFNTFKVSAFKLPNSKVVRVKKEEVDLYVMSLEL